MLAGAELTKRLVLEWVGLEDVPQRIDAVGDQAFKIEGDLGSTIVEPAQLRRAASVMPGGRPFLRSASFCGNSGTMKASLVSAACEVVDAMKIAKAKLAEIAKDLARPTVMHMVCSPLLLCGTGSAREHSCAATNACTPRAGGLTTGALPRPFNERCGRLFALGRSEWAPVATFSHGCDCARRGAVQPYLKP